MARPTVATKDEVFKAADRLKAKERTVSARAIRDEIGGGSLATILPHFRAWQGDQVKKGAEPIVVPPTMIRALSDLIAGEIAANRAELDNELERMQQVEDALVAEAAAATQKLDELTEELKTLAMERSRLSGQLYQAMQDVEVLQGGLAAASKAAESARLDYAKAELRLEDLPRLQQELAQTQRALAEERATRAKEERNAAVAESRATVAEERRVAAEARSDRYEQEAREAREALASTRRNG